MGRESLLVVWGGWRWRGETTPQGLAGPYLHPKSLRTQMTGSTQRCAWTGIGLPACSGMTGFLLEFLGSH